MIAVTDINHEKIMKDWKMEILKTENRVKSFFEKMMESSRTVAKDLWVCNMPLEYYMDLLNHGIIIAVINNNNEIVGGLTYNFVDEDDLTTLANLRKDIHLGIAENCFVYAGYRGNHLEYEMLLYLEEILVERNMKRVIEHRYTTFIPEVSLATVSPNNKASLASCLKAGWQIVCTKNVFGEERLIIQKVHRY